MDKIKESGGVIVNVEEKKCSKLAVKGKDD